MQPKAMIEIESVIEIMASAMKLIILFVQRDFFLFWILWHFEYISLLMFWLCVVEFRPINKNKLTKRALLFLSTINLLIEKPFTLFTNIVLFWLLLIIPCPWPWIFFWWVSVKTVCIQQINCPIQYLVYYSHKWE